MRPIKKQPVSNLLAQLSSYHDLRYPVNLPEAEVYEYANESGGLYNYDRAMELGYEPDEFGHLPSVDDQNGMWLKSAKHPTAVKELLHGYLGSDHYKTHKLITNPEGYFGEDQLQYIPRKMQDGVSRAGRYNPQAIQDFEDRRKQTLYERWMESDDDSLAEDLFELIDVTGAYSHDDFKAAKESWRQSGRNLPSFSEFLDMVGAVPFVGTAKIPFKLLKRGKNVGDAIKVISSADYIKKMLPLGELLEGAGFLQDRTQE